MLKLRELSKKKVNVKILVFWYKEDKYLMSVIDFSEIRFSKMNTLSGRKRYVLQLPQKYQPEYEKFRKCPKNFLKNGYV